MTFFLLCLFLPCKNCTSENPILKHQTTIPVEISFFGISGWLRLPPGELRPQNVVRLKAQKASGAAIAPGAASVNLVCRVILRTPTGGERRKNLRPEHSRGVSPLPLIILVAGDPVRGLGVTSGSSASKRIYRHCPRIRQSIFRLSPLANDQQHNERSLHRLSSIPVAVQSS